MLPRCCPLLRPIASNDCGQPVQRRRSILENTARLRQHQVQAPAEVFDQHVVTAIHLLPAWRKGANPACGSNPRTPVPAVGQNRSHGFAQCVSKPHLEHRAAVGLQFTPERAQVSQNARCPPNAKCVLFEQVFRGGSTSEEVPGCVNGLSRSNGIQLTRSAQAFEIGKCGL